MALSNLQTAHGRQHERHEVQLAVRFERASDFVSQYAHNLSRGGLFVSGAHELELHASITVEVDLPGSGTFEVEAEVVHVLCPQDAEKAGRSPGAGLMITRRPPGFRRAMEAYLWRLGRRRGMAVMVDAEHVARTCKHAGYTPVRAPVPSEVVATIARCDKPVLAIVVSSSRLAEYMPIAESAGGADILISYAPTSYPQSILPKLDEKLG